MRGCRRQIDVATDILRTLPSSLCKTILIASFYKPAERLHMTPAHIRLRYQMAGHHFHTQICVSKLQRN